MADVYVKAEKKMLNGDYNGALESLKHASNDVDACQYRADCYRMLKEYDNAIENYNTFLTRRELVADMAGFYVTYIIYYSRANTYLEMGKYEKAIEDYTWAMQISFEEDIYDLYPALYNNRGYAFYKLGKLKEAQIDWERAAFMGNYYGSQLAKKNLRTTEKEYVNRLEYVEFKKAEKIKEGNKNFIICTVIFGSIGLAPLFLGAPSSFATPMAVGGFFWGALTGFFKKRMNFITAFIISTVIFIAAGFIVTSFIDSKPKTEKTEQTQTRQQKLPPYVVATTDVGVFRNPGRRLIMNVGQGSVFEVTGKVKNGYIPVRIRSAALKGWVKEEDVEEFKIPE